MTSVTPFHLCVSVSLLDLFSKDSPLLDPKIPGPCPYSWLSLSWSLCAPFFPTEILKLNLIGLSWIVFWAPVALSSGWTKLYPLRNKGWSFYLVVGRSIWESFCIGHCSYKYFPIHWSPWMGFTPPARSRSWAPAAACEIIIPKLNINYILIGLLAQDSY